MMSMTKEKKKDIEIVQFKGPKGEGMTMKLSSKEKDDCCCDGDCEGCPC